MVPTKSNVASGINAASVKLHESVQQECVNANLSQEDVIRLSYYSFMRIN